MRPHLLKNLLPKGAFLLLLIGLMLSASMTVSASASFTVNSTADASDANPGDGVCATRDGLCTLRAAIQESNALGGDDTIMLPAGTYTLTIEGLLDDKGLLGDLDIQDNLTLTGEGAQSTIIDGNQLDRVLHIINGYTVVEISGVTIRNGNTPFSLGGGGMLNQGTLTLNDSIVTSNSSEESGGGIYNQGVLTVGNSTISHNKSNDDGGGLYNRGMLTLNNSIVQENDRHGIVNQGALWADNSTIVQNEGQGILNAWSVILSGCRVDANTSGGIVNTGTLELTNSTLSNNRSTEGGGIANQGRLTVNHSTIKDNSALLGGGISNQDTLLLNSSIVSGNVATHHGGGISNTLNGQVIFSGSTITNNMAKGSGGAIYNWSGNLFVNQSTMSSNRADSDGGAIYNNDRVTVNNSTISRNHANLNGGGIYHGPRESDQLSLNNVTITENSADSDENESGDGGGIFNGIGQVYVQNTIIAGNHDNSPTTQHPNCSTVQAFFSLGYNLIQDVSGCSISGETESNLIGLGPNLGPLENNGGPTLTHALPVDSSAIDAGNPAGCTDQNGTPLNKDQIDTRRPLDGNEDGTAICDIGAFEQDRFEPIAFIHLPLVAKALNIIPSSSSALLPAKPNQQQALTLSSLLGIGFFFGACVFALVWTVEEEDEYWQNEGANLPSQEV